MQENDGTAAVSTDAGFTWLEVPARGRLSRDSRLPAEWAVWRVETRVPGHDAHFSAELALREFEAAMRVSILRLDSSMVVLYPREPDHRLPDTWVGVLRLPAGESVR